MRLTVGDLVTVQDLPEAVRVAQLTTLPESTTLAVWVTTSAAPFVGPYPVADCTLVTPCEALPRSHWGDQDEHLARLRVKAATDLARDLRAGWLSSPRRG